MANNAQLQLSHTIIAAPTAGTIGNKAVQVEQRVQSSQTPMAVKTQQPRVVANFKETQLGRRQPGQTVEIKIDAFPVVITVATQGEDKRYPHCSASMRLLCCPKLRSASVQ
ncbi:hypothetical protein JOY44_27220 (plasmid) [Phormidium sp. CLA17]|uniref:hypothetical protein n=1 Tax=Leptolyngbya sp. Cla-17 TaxID=2803751 RepID=UPI0014916937|nr:hypothetical protein [Leptolyngbya sp. Cla-17]MBM0745169.1 hypothetical protein [Leptolyngbya sp. Cla-17]